MIDDDFSFEEDTHTYRNSDGVVRPSVTGTLKTAGLVDYSMVPPELLEAKRIIGTNVHRWTAKYDLEGDADPLELTEREYGYAQGWLAFRRDFRPQILEVEKPMLRTIAGLEIGGTPDRLLLFDRRVWILDLKCCSSEMPAWEIQLAEYEMLHTGQPIIGVYGRMSLRLPGDGRYVPKVHIDMNAATIATAAVYRAHGFKHQYLEDTLEAWKHNRRVRAA